MRVYVEKAGLRNFVYNQLPRLEAYKLELIEEYPEFKNRLKEIHRETMIVLEKIIKKHKKTAMKEYYERFYNMLHKIPNSSEDNLREYAKNLYLFIYDDEV